MISSNLNRNFYMPFMSMHFICLKDLDNVLTINIYFNWFT